MCLCLSQLLMDQKSIRFLFMEALSGASGMCPFGVLQITSGNSAFLAQRNVTIRTVSVINIMNKQKHFLGSMKHYFEGLNYSC